MDSRENLSFCLSTPAEKGAQEENRQDKRYQAAAGGAGGIAELIELPCEFLVGHAGAQRRGPSG